jgi:hypothetical protein
VGKVHKGVASFSSTTLTAWRKRTHPTKLEANSPPKPKARRRRKRVQRFAGLAAFFAGLADLFAGPADLFAGPADLFAGPADLFAGGVAFLWGDFFFAGARWRAGFVGVAFERFGFRTVEGGLDLDGGLDGTIGRGKK